MRRIPLEWRLAALTVAGALPAVALIGVAALSPLPVWAIALAGTGALLAAVAAALAIRRRLGRSFEQLTGLIHSIRDGEYSLRAPPQRGDFGRSLAALNAFADELGGLHRAGIESDALLGKLLSTLDLALLVFDSSGRLTSANSAAARLVGRESEPLRGLSAQDLGLADWLEVPRSLRTSRHFAGGEGPWEVRVARFHRGGKPHRLLVVTDLSKALRAEERLAWHSLIRVLTHETGNSLGPIQSTADALMRCLQRTPLDPEAEKTLGTGLELIERRAKHLSEFIHHYGQLARLPAPQLRPLDLAEIVPRVAALENRLQAKISTPATLMVRADPAQLEQALINLVKNAADAALETGGTVHLHWMRENDRAVIEVLDDGPGLPQTENLFVPFFTTKPGGSGIGLVLARQIAEAHGGDLHVTDRLDSRGVRALLTLPLAEP